MVKQFFILGLLLATGALSMAQDESETIGTYVFNESVFYQKEVERAKCGNHNGYKYCLHEGEGERKNELMYHFHGVLADELNFIKNKAFIRLQKLWIKDGRGRPQVISISYGPAWVLTSKNSRYLSGLLDNWKADAFADLEAFLGIKNVTKRFLVGDSMGGHNVLKVFYQNPDLFDRVMALCPAQLVNSPYASMESVLDTLPQVQSIWPMYFAAMGLMASFYDEPMWNKESPMYFSDDFLKNTDKLRILLTDHDMYGFTKTNLSWIEDIEKRGKKIEYKIEPGLHCTPNNLTYVNDFLK